MKRRSRDEEREQRITITQRSISPLRVGDEVDVVEMAPEEDAGTSCSS